MSDITSLSQGKIQAIFNYYGKKSIDDREPATLVYLGIDDIAVRKGHNYLTVVYNQATGSIIDTNQQAYRPKNFQVLNLCYFVIYCMSIPSICPSIHSYIKDINSTMYLSWLLSILLKSILLNLLIKSSCCTL